MDVNVYNPQEKYLINEYRIQSIPTSIFMDKNGVVEDRVACVIPEKELRKYLTKLVRKKI